MHDRYSHLEAIRQSLANCSAHLCGTQKIEALENIKKAYLYEMGSEERYPVRSIISYK